MHTRLRRILITATTVLTLGAASLATMGANGCSKQATAAALLVAIGNDVRIALVDSGTPAAEAQNIDNLFQLASTDVASWKPGTDASEAIQAINDADVALDAVIPQGNAKVYIDLALGSAESLITLITGESGGTPVATGGLAQPASRHSSTRTPRHVALANPPKTAADFQSQWKALGGGH